MPRDRRPYIILPIAAFIAVLPLILRGCSCGHDFDFHIINWFEAAHQFSHGVIHPHWVVTPAWNAGEPRFVFYPPLSWTIGGILGLMMPWQWTPVVYIWLALTVAALALNYAARGFATPNAALVAAAIYIANPYTLYTAYERSDYAELLAAAWFPLLIDAILRDRVSIPRIAIPVALLWLTNAPAAVMGCYALALLALLRIFVPASIPAAMRAPSSRHRVSGPLQESATTSLSTGEDRSGMNQFRIAINTAAGTLLGLGLAAFYIVPAAYERRFVQIALAIIPGMRPADNFLFHHTLDPDHDAVLHTASVVAIFVILLTAAALLLAHSRRMVAPDEPGAPLTQAHPVNSLEVRAYILHLTIFALAIAFMLLPLSAPIWAHLPELRFLQFPWRLLSILATVFALALAIALSRLPLKTMESTAVALFATAIFTLPAYVTFNQGCYPEDSLPARLAIFQSANPGTDPVDEYTPNAADNNALASTNPGYWLAPDAGASAPANSKPNSAPQHLVLTPATAQVLILNLRDYPAWRVTLNGSLMATRLHRDDGLIAIAVPPGPSRIDISYAPLADQDLGYLLSALSLLAFTALLVRSHRQSESSA